MIPKDGAEFASREELDEIGRLVTHTGASLEQLLHLRGVVLHAAAVRLRDWRGPEFIEERWATGKEEAADFIDPALTQ